MSRHGHPLHCDVTGSGLPVVLLHGVVYGPSRFAPLVEAAAGSIRSIVPHRRGYGRSWDAPLPGCLDDQVSDLVGVIQRHAAEPAVVAGVSGGATLALALAIRSPAHVRRLVVHEPALGPLAPDVAAILDEAASALTAGRSPLRPARALARRLAGDHLWPTVSRTLETGRRLASVVANEVPHFAAFAPEAEDLRALRGLPFVSSVGRRSATARHAASRVLVDLAEAREVGLPCGHLAQIEAPRALLAAIVEAE